MTKPRQSFLTAIDVGSSKTCAIVAEIADSGLCYRGHGIAPSRGSRKGIIVDLDRAVATIQKAVEAAEDSAGTAIERAIVGVAGAHIRGINSRGGVVLGSRAREITREDIRQAVERARSISLPPDREILHLLPQEFVLDEQAGIRDPVGMIGHRLEVKVHVVTGASSAVQNVVTALNRAGIHVDDTVFESIACADAVLDAEERELGVCLADIGAGSTDLVVFHEGSVAHTAVIPLGGDHFTSDLSVGLRTPLADAERIKRRFGRAVVTSINADSEIEVPAVGDRPSRMLPQRLLGEILEPRARELFELVRENLRHAGVLEMCAAGVVLTGGAARLPELQEIAGSVLRLQARVGWATLISKSPADLTQPECATAVGLLLYGHRVRLARGAHDDRVSTRLKLLFAKRAL
jgi:cell division protein FtsA